uniref:Putative secreted peptide n=1 Tax=Rhipicephalus pulchellus TaxID=72859 RepID=L7M903_RHIPC
MRAHVVIVVPYVAVVMLWTLCKCLTAVYGSTCYFHILFFCFAHHTHANENVEARVPRFRHTLKNPRWSKFPEPSTMAPLTMTWWFWDVKPQILLLLHACKASSKDVLAMQKKICTGACSDGPRS